MRMHHSLGLTILLGAATLPAPAAAQAVCDVARSVPGVRDPGSVSILMTGMPLDEGRLRISRVSYPNYRDIAGRPASVALAAYQGFEGRVSARGRSEREIRGEFVSGSYFDVLGAAMQAGRGFSAGDDAEDAAPAAVISDSLWTALFDRDPSAVGQPLTVNGRAVPIVGIADPAFQGVRATWKDEVWLTGSTQPVVERGGPPSGDRVRGGYYQFVARLAAGAAWPDAHDELDALTAWLADRYPEANEKFALVGFHDYGPLTCAD